MRFAIAKPPEIQKALVDAVDLYLWGEVLIDFNDPPANIAIYVELGSRSGTGMLGRNWRRPK